jgi:HK97 family phage major capsid protein
MSAGRAIGNALGNSLINGGNGISGSILSAPVAVTGGSASAVTAPNQVAGGPSYTNLIDMEYSVIAPYRQSRSCYWLAADKTLGSLRKLTDTVGRPIWEPSTVLGSPDLMLGKPLVADPFMPAYGTGVAGSIAFGDFSQYFVRMVGGVRFERSDDFAFGSDLVSFRAIIRADGQLMNPPTTVTPSLKGQPLVLFQGGATA